MFSTKIMYHGLDKNTHTSTENKILYTSYTEINQKLLYVVKKKSINVISIGGSTILQLITYYYNLLTLKYSVFLHSPSDNVRLSELLRISPEVPGQKYPEGGHFPIKKGTFLEIVSKHTVTCTHY